MPVMFEIAAYAALIIGSDQTGVDPQVDKQYAIVKSGKPIVPTELVNVSSNHEEDRSIHIDQQDGLTSTQGAPAKAGDAPRAATAGQATTASSGAIILQGQATAPPIPPTVTLAPGQSIGSYSLIAPTAAAMPAQAMKVYQMNGLSRMKGMDKPVSVHFTNASAADVLKWLAKQNVNFVANVDKMPKSKITVNLNHVPLHEALETVAQSLGGSWQVNGSTLVFQTGRANSISYMPGNLGSMNGFGEMKEFGDLKAFSKNNESGLKAFSLAHEKGLIDFAQSHPMNFKFLEGFESMLGTTKDGKVFEFKMDPSQMKAYEKAMTEMKIQMKDMPKMDPKMFEELKSLKGLGGDMFVLPKGFEKMSPSQKQEFEKAMTEMKIHMKNMPKMDPKMFEELKSLKGLTSAGTPFTFKVAPNSKDGKSFGLGSGNSLFGQANTFKKIDGAKFLKSVSPAQKELMKKQGYLKFSDLTQDQRNMRLDGSTKSLPENFTFMFSANGEKITIKNK
ncbi:MAG: hypothetical protein WCG75_00915 [Armatimonadota bacterium]